MTRAKPTALIAMDRGEATGHDSGPPVSQALQDGSKLGQVGRIRGDGVGWVLRGYVWEIGAHRKG
jgi:hypothetical protein